MKIPRPSPIDLQILQALFEEPNLNKRRLDTYTGLHPKTTQDHLEKLVKQNFIHEEGDHKPGKKLFYSLTEEGREYFIEQTVDNLNLSFKSIQKMAGIIASKPSDLKQFRESLKENPPFIAGEEIEKHMENVERTHAPLREAYKTMRRIYLEVWGSRQPNGELLDVAITLTKEGYIYMIPVALLKKHGLGVGL